ncbi:hypothetical protein QA640_12365 [Bradyrhizobium sp. CB82]|jgi:hypothetical protein|uniref:hypothetical protein n=1 Tax=Bradyrhizobium sp. CB82 TaxID=3039159 RepID=UPI0024B088D7|nr:hypothetical protein [Bradyrhizobium sp. CB82]WFU43166.1 hypothetical protein QA640_12365 [Bradyrhizobium sp. CB82]
MKNAYKKWWLGAAIIACSAIGSVQWSPEYVPSFSVDSAQARVGRPATPVSAAGVARRTTRRAVVGGAAVGATVGAAVAAPACARVLVNGVWVCR